MKYSEKDFTLVWKRLGFDEYAFMTCGTRASLLIQQNANVKYIQQQLGHSSINITLDVYSHLFEGDHRHQVLRLDDEVISACSTAVETSEKRPSWTLR